MVFGPEISRYPEVVRGHERELVGQRSWQAVGDGTAERVGVELWTDAVDSGDSSRVDRVQQEDRVKRCWHSSWFLEFSLVTHASVILHMHVVLHTLLLL